MKLIYYVKNEENKIEVLYEADNISTKQIPTFNEKIVAEDGNIYFVNDIFRNIVNNTIYVFCQESGLNFNNDLVFFNIEDNLAENEVIEEVLSEKEIEELIQLSISKVAEYDYIKLCEFGLEYLYKKGSIPIKKLANMPKIYNRQNTYDLIAKTFLNIKAKKENPEGLPIAKNNFAKGVQ